MPETGGDGFQIAKGFVSVEARVNDASVTSARQKLAGSGAAAAGGSAPQPQPQPAQPAATQTLGDRLADARASLASTGTQAARTLEQGFRAGLSSLSSMAVQQLKSVSGATPASPRPMPDVRTPVGTGGAVGAAGLQAQTAQIAAALSRTLGPQVAQQVTALIRQQAVAQRATPAPAAPAQAPTAAPRTATRGASSGGQVVNNYTTNVRIEPKFVSQLLSVIRDINQLKSRNRATR